MMQTKSPAFPFKAWLKASRLPSQSYIFMPLLLGQACHYHLQGRIDWGLFIVLHLFGLFNQLYIVYANDYADRDSDHFNTTFNLFSGGSRALIDGDLTPLHLKRGALLMACLCLLIGAGLTICCQRWLAVPIVIIALLLLWAYSYPPLMMSYRGGGELLQTLGVGLVLPFFAYYSQEGSADRFPWLLILMLLPSQLACAMSTSLPDEPADRRAEKRTTSVLFGGAQTRFLVFLLNLATVLMIFGLTAPLLTMQQRLAVIALPALSAVGHLFVIDGRPGSRKLMVFNFLSVLTVLSIQLGICIVFFSG